MSIELSRINKDYTPSERAFLRVMAVILGPIGAATCIYSLILQISDTGSLYASLTWFAGLFGVVIAISSYVCAVDFFSKKNNHLLISLIIGGILTIIFFTCMRLYFYSSQVIIVAVIAMLLQSVTLLIYHIVLRLRVIKARTENKE